MSRPHALYRPLLTAVWLAAIVSGCATSTLAPEVPTAERRTITAFELDGRLLATDGEQAASGRMLWRHAPTSDKWTMYSPLGQIVAQLISSPTGAHLQTADGRRFSAPDAQSMLPELLGVPAPIAALAYWVQATPRTGARILLQDAAGRPTRITDEGWIIDYTAYANADADAPPRRIEASWGAARLRLIIDAWTPLP